MALNLKNFGDDTLDQDYLSYLVDQLSPDHSRQYSRLWDYFRNPMTPAAGLALGALNTCSRPYFQAQELGLPARITGVNRSAGSDTTTDMRRKEVVIENDIAWRIHTMVDFLFGKSPSIRSLAADPAHAAAIEQVISALIDANGGVAFFQEMALLGSVYGFVDIALRTPADGSAELPTYAHPASPAHDAATPTASAPVPPPSGSRPVTSTPTPLQLTRAIQTASRLQLETIEAPRTLPVMEEYDYRRLRYWVQRFFIHPSRLAESRKPFLGLFSPRRPNSPKPAICEVIEIIGPTWWQRYEDRELVAEGPNALGRLNVVHIQNLALSGSYSGLGDVEPLIPLQDELNTRLSDRAQRVTYQSFKMYLGKGIDDFLERPVGPGQMWATQNPQATIEEFGTDSGSPSEDAHIEQVRNALDKVSSVSPLAAGLIQGNVGNLTSATALKVLLGGLLARTERKRQSYGAGIAQIVELALDWLDRVGVLHTSPADRKIEIHWPNMIPADQGEMLRNAQIKAQLGLPREQILAELGYDRDQTQPANPA